MRFVMDVKPRFDYGRAAHKLAISDDGAVFSTDGMELTLNPVGERTVPLGEQGLSVERQGDDLRLTRTLREGGTAGVVLESMGGQPRRIPPAELEQLTEDTARFWRGWVGHSTYRGRWREMVARSAMTLKLMTYAPTGALVAAPTAGLPELTGGERNWDYRYTWIRDASFSVYALLGLGYAEEAVAFGRWLKDRSLESAGTGSGPLKIMYRVDGSSDLTEETLDHFEGWRASRPVRIGNGASDQLQLDIYGEALDAMFHADSRGLGMAHEGWMNIARIMDWVCDHWDQPEEGIWETRGGRKDFTYGRFQCWVALDRAIRLAGRRGRPGNVGRWTAERDKLYHQIMSQGWNPLKGTFTQHYGSDVLDASLLLMPLMGFVSPTDPMWLSTLEAMDYELVSDSLVYRYNPGASPDGLRRGHRHGGGQERRPDDPADNFATIVFAVEQDRKIYDNLTKYIRFVLVLLVVFVLTFLGATLFNIAAGEPFTPAQVLWIHFVVNAPFGFALGFDRESPVSWPAGRAPGASRC
ncbi:MAG: glycoside hydrolase family 15 protein [Streptosporangiaceae bacterium]